MFAGRCPDTLTKEITCNHGVQVHVDEDAPRRGHTLEGYVDQDQAATHHLQAIVEGYAGH